VDKVLDPAMDVRRAVLGGDYVDRAVANASEFTGPFQEFVTRYVWGECWLDETLDRRTRSLLTLSIVTVLGQRDEIRLHARGAIRNGCTAAEIAATLKNVAVYAGVAAAVVAVNIANEELAATDTRIAPAEEPK
jgi:alkylhydroperoxidase/carboxymuconolactone decarboxylase family protein YurZ